MKIKIDGGKIIDLDSILAFVKTTSDYSYLNYLLDAIEEYQVQSENFLPVDFIKLKKEINNRLSSLNVTKAEFDIKSIIVKLLNGDGLSGDEYKYLTDKMSLLISKMSEGLDPLEQNLLDVFVDAIKDKSDLNPKWKDIVFAYYKIIDEKAKAKLLEDKNAYQNEHRVLKIEKMKKDNEGKVLTITILEVVIIIGVLIAFLMIALI